MTVKDFLDKLSANYSDLDHSIRTHKTYDNRRAYQAREIIKKAYSVLSQTKKRKKTGRLLDCEKPVTDDSIMNENESTKVANFKEDSSV
jgi:hypothetical protein